MAVTNQANIKELSDKGSDGTRLGQSSTDKISFFGAAVTTRPSVAAASSSVATTTILETRVAAICTALAALGLISNP
jgi:hypothetical protein